jgi:hypothetical protein
VRIDGVQLDSSFRFISHCHRDLLSPLLQHG